jgi:hemoglobin-like flavoprotein
MLHSERQLVQSTWATVAPNAAAIGALFYDRMFELDPSLRALFGVTTAEQGKKLTQILAVAIASLDRLEHLIPALEALGRRHVDYGVRDEHYETGGRALLDTLALGLGDAFTAEVRAAWTAAYTALTGVMRRAAAEEEARLRDGAAISRTAARRQRTRAVA